MGFRFGRSLQKASFRRNAQPILPSASAMLCITSIRTVSSIVTSGPNTSWSIANDHIKLINFGLASQVAAKRITFVSLARELNTVRYASPEEIRGQHCDARSDVYSIGVMLYEMLTGTLPYENNYLLAHANDPRLKDPTPPRKLEPTITPQMQQIVLRAMDQTPRYRYASAHEMAQDLTHMQDVVVDEGTSHRSYRTTAAWNKNFLFYIVLAAIPVILFVLMMLATHHR